MQNKFENMINSDFGKIRKVYFNKYVKSFLIETEFGFQFILREGKILTNNVDHKFKIIGNTFPDEQVFFILQNRLYSVWRKTLIFSKSSRFFEIGSATF